MEPAAAAHARGRLFMDFYRDPFAKVLSQVTKQLRHVGFPFLLAIDGACCAGKTTLAQALASKLGAPVFHIDDFYLPFARRTPQRLQMPGGHIEWERLEQQVLGPAAQGVSLVYQAYDAHNDSWRAERKISPQKIYIVEGTYSLLPPLEKYYDYKVFLKLDTGSQYRRLQKRESKEKLIGFINRWIPEEERYFRDYCTGSCANLVFDTSDRR